MQAEKECPCAPSPVAFVSLAPLADSRTQEMPWVSCTVLHPTPIVG